MKYSLIIAIGLVLASSNAIASISREVVQCTSTHQGAQNASFTLTKAVVETGIVHFAEISATIKNRVFESVRQSVELLQIERTPIEDGGGNIFENDDEHFSVVLVRDRFSAVPGSDNWTLSGSFTDVETGQQINIKVTVDCQFGQ